MLSASKSEWNWSLKLCLEREDRPKITWSKSWVCVYENDKQKFISKDTKRQNSVSAVFREMMWSVFAYWSDLQCVDVECVCILIRSSVCESVYSAVSLTLHHWHTQQSSSTWPSSSSSGLSQRLLKVCGAQVWYSFISSSILSKF